MGFAKRSAQANLLVRLFQEHYWSSPQIIKHGFGHQEYGYETHVASEVRDVLVGEASDATAMDVRFRPDFLLVKRDYPRRAVVLLEYKATTTPRYTEGENQWHVGQFEAAPWCYYLELANAGRRVALLNYCSYHARPLLCDFVSPEWLIRSRSSVMHTSRGSGTDYVNVDLRRLRSFDVFMEDEFGVPRETSKCRLDAILRAALASEGLRTKHHRSSPHFGRADTGFNWTTR